MIFLISENPISYHNIRNININTTDNTAHKKADNDFTYADLFIDLAR